MIDEQRLARCRTGLGQRFASGQHVYQTALAHIASPNEGKLRHFGVRTTVGATVADMKFGGFNYHVKFVDYKVNARESTK